MNDDEPLCPHCNGSGEGPCDGTTCHYCHGGGVQHAVYDPEDDE